MSSSQIAMGFYPTVQNTFEHLREDPQELLIPGASFEEFEEGLEYSISLPETPLHLLSHPGASGYIEPQKLYLDTDSRHAELSFLGDEEISRYIQGDKVYEEDRMFNLWAYSGLAPVIRHDSLGVLSRDDAEKAATADANEKSALLVPLGWLSAFTVYVRFLSTNHDHRYPK